MKRWCCALLAALAVAFAGKYGWRYLAVSRALAAARSDVFGPEPEAAVENIARLQAENPGSVRGESAELAYLLAIAHRRAGKTADAADDLKRAAELGWSKSDILREKYLVDFQGGKFAETKPHIDAMLLDPHSDEVASEIYECLVMGCLVEVRVFDALAYLDFWLRWQPDSVRAHVLRSEAMEAINNRRGLLDEYRKILELDAGNKIALMRLGFSLLEDNEVEEARKQFEQYLARWPDDAVVQVGLASCERRMGETAKPKATLQRALEAELPDIQRGFALTELGHIALAERSYREAQDYFERAVQVSPGSHVNHYNLAMALSRSGQTEAAEEQMERSRSLKAQAARLDELLESIVSRPQDPAPRCEAGEILLDQGKSKEAYVWLLSALRLDPSSADTHRALVRYYAGKGDDEMAEKHRAVAEGRVAVVDKDKP
ncbi:MAG TPA: tetratricopeptide repeat protein [Pirellulales bacterium]|nr:tetratricopeptide repeat protein [Pirellulales bacterium]